jgi:hypothetical protein
MVRVLPLGGTAASVMFRSTSWFFIACFNAPCNTLCITWMPPADMLACCRSL